MIFYGLQIHYRIANDKDDRVVTDTLSSSHIWCTSEQAGDNISDFVDRTRKNLASVFSKEQKFIATEAKIVTYEL